MVFTSQTVMEEDKQVTPPEYMPPVLDVKGNFISAKTELEKRLIIIQGQNERLARKMDAAHIIDELNRGLWDLDEEDATEWQPGPFAILKAKWDSQSIHFKDGGPLFPEDKK